MTETHPKITAGIDVGKAQLELSISAGPTQIYANDPEGISALTLELARQPEPIALAVHEPTGGYERLLTTLLAEAGVPARRVHPKRCAPTPGPADSRPKPTAWTPKPCPATPPPLTCPPTRPPKPKTPECAPSSKTCSGGGSS